MLNRLEALRYFCYLAESLNFRETAVQLSVSPPVVTRIISELENELGEMLFKRNSRNVSLTVFGEQFLPKAQQLLANSDTLFHNVKKQDEISGFVRVTSLDLPEKKQILMALLKKLEAYPNVHLDWVTDIDALDSISKRIDIGIRSSIIPDPNFIIRRIKTERSLIVASPEFIDKYGKPKNVMDLKDNYPFAGLINPDTGKIWPLTVNEEIGFIPSNVQFITNDPYAELYATLSSRAFGQISELLCQPYLNTGELIELFPELDYQEWQFYLYRPYQSITNQAVLKVFDLLEDILKNNIFS